MRAFPGLATCTEDHMIRPIHIPILAAVFTLGCSPSSTGPKPLRPSAAVATNAGTTNTKGIGGAMPAYYDGKLFTINFSELPSGGESSTLAHNGSFNIIYQSDGCTPDGQMFVSVIDAVPTDGFNPLWQEVQIVFTNPSACQQFTSDEDITAAATAGVITLVPTTEMYRCSVIGKSQ